MITLKQVEDFFKNICPSFTEGSVEFAIEEYEQSKWVEFVTYDTKTHPPFHGYKALVVVRGGFVKVDSYFESDTIGAEGYFNENYGRVTHWQPLPEPTK